MYLNFDLIFCRETEGFALFQTPRDSIAPRRNMTFRPTRTSHYHPDIFHISNSLSRLSLRRFPLGSLQSAKSLAGTTAAPNEMLLCPR